jgi:hypothetical protein
MSPVVAVSLATNQFCLKAVCLFAILGYTLIDAAHITSPDPPSSPSKVATKSFLLEMNLKSRALCIPKFTLHCKKSCMRLTSFSISSVSESAIGHIAEISHIWNAHLQQVYTSALMPALHVSPLAFAATSEELFF